jgi:hypothetical protein
MPEFLGSGKSFEDPIKIEGAKDHFDAINAEYMYIEHLYGKRNEDWMLIKQTLNNIEDKVYDKLEIRCRDGNEIHLHFDITEYFGKF